jgi:hypothetical protein
MPNPQMEALKAHIAACSVCSAANRRVNDFCGTGQLLFREWAKDHPPIAAVETEITKEQFDRMVAEAERRQRQAERN